MNEYLDKIRQEIEKKKSDIMTKLDSFDISMLGNINSNISTAINIIDELTNSNEIDFSIISSILGSMPQYRLGEMVVGDSDTYQKIYEMLKDMKKDNEETSGFFDDDIEKYSKVFTNLADEIKHFITNKRNEYNEIISQKRELALKLKEIRSIGIIIDKYSHEQVILSDEIQKLYTYLINENEQLSLEEKFDFYRTFSQINTERISAMLNERVTENVEEELASAEETTNEDFQMIQLENLVEQINNVDNADNQDIVEDNNENSEQNMSEDGLLGLIGKENLTLYKNAKLLIEQYKSQMENIEITSLIPINNSEERKRAYEVYIYEDFDQAKKFILDDIENKILFEIKKDLDEGIFSEESFEDLEFAYNEFENVVNMEQDKIAKKKLKEKKEQTNYMDILEELQMKNAIDLCNKVQSLLTECSIRAKNETIFRNAISQYTLNLNASFDEFIDALKDYYFKKDNEDFKEILFDIAFPNLVQTYDDFLGVYNMYTVKKISNGNLENEYVDNALSFYDRYNNINHILLVCDDSGISYIEDDINNSREITKKSQALSNVVHKLGLFADNDKYEIENGHDVKTSNFSEAIKKEFQIRSSSCGSDLRIFYSKFSTKLNEIFPEKYDKLPSIIFIYEVAYGATDKEKKNVINQKAYKRCYDRREELRNIRKLFNTDISNCTEQEKQSIRKQIQESIRNQNIKLGHLIVEEANTKENENEKGIGGVE